MIDVLPLSNFSFTDFGARMIMLAGNSLLVVMTRARIRTRTSNIQRRHLIE